MSTDRMSFDEACRELGVSEAELEQLVAAGEIASIKEGDTLFFKKDVVRKFKKSRESEPTILLADDEIGLLEEEDAEKIDLLKLDEESPTPRKTAPVAAGKGAEKGGKAGGGGREASEGAEISLDDDAGLPEIDLGEGAEESPGTKKLEEVSVRGEKKGQADSEETLLNIDGLLEEDSEATTPVPGGVEDDSTLLDTDLLDLGGESDPFTSDTVEETQGAELATQGTLLRGGGARVMQMKRRQSHAGWTAVLACTGLFLLLPLGVLTNLMFLQSSEARESSKDAYGWITDFPASDLVNSVVTGVAGLFSGK